MLITCCTLSLLGISHAEQPSVVFSEVSCRVEVVERKRGWRGAEMSCVWPAVRIDQCNIVQRVMSPHWSTVSIQSPASMRMYSWKDLGSAIMSQVHCNPICSLSTTGCHIRFLDPCLDSLISLKDLCLQMHLSLNITFCDISFIHSCQKLGASLWDITGYSRSTMRQRIWQFFLQMLL